MGKRVLMIDDFHESLALGLTTQGFVVIDACNCRADNESVLALLQFHKPEGLLVRSKLFIGEELLANQSQLKWIGRGGAGMDNLNMQACLSRGVVCFNAGEANADAVGEHTLAMLLALFTQLVKSHQEVVAGIWNREGNRGIELRGKTLGILGYGNTGSAVAKKLSGFGVRVLAFDKYKIGFSDEFVTEVDENTLLAESDVLSLHVPLTDETHNWFNQTRCNAMKNGIWLLNLSRGAVVDLGVVAGELEKGKIQGFGADVLTIEPPMMGNDLFMDIFNRLRKNNRVVFSPHVGGWTVESYEKISRVLLDKVLNLYDIPR